MSMRLTSKKEDGLVSIVVVSVIIIILALMTIGFAKIMDRELRQSLDRELASQANYAAESGINDVRAYKDAYINAGNDPDGLSTTPGQCLDTANPPGGVAPNPFISQGNISSNNVVKYTCIIINSTPKDLIYDIKQGESVVFRVVPTSNLNRLFFSWENQPDASGNVCYSPLPGSPNQLPKENDFSSLCQTGLLRASIYPVPKGGLPADPSPSLNAGSGTFFMYPNAAGANSVGVQNFSNDGSFANGNCNQANRSNAPTGLPFQQGTPRICNSEITGVPNTPMYFVKLTALYRDLAVSVQGSNGGTPVQIGSAEALVDVTGSGNDVLKRLQGRVTLGGNVSYPAFGAQSMDTLCKELRVPKIGPNSYDTAIYNDPNAADANVAAACGYGGLIPNG
jgi:type II secretory pathway pseudopilin PulG